MSELINDRKVFSLREVSLSIQKTISERYKSLYWIKTEINKLNYYPHSGHCYPDLLEKDGVAIVAQFRANLWKSDYQKINSNFIKVLKEPLKDGISVLICAYIQYDQVHGLSLRIIDIDPVFSLGELEKEKQNSINKLKAEGIFNHNKLLRMPLLPKRIAIISVETSKGYSDFKKVIDLNPWNYNFFYMLFPSLLQGEKSIESIINQLNNIRKLLKHFDVVAIIRGGGGEVGLSSYNNYQLAKEIALFPIPVISGIGHSTNETVSEMVSHYTAITPTELADFLIQKFHNFSIPLNGAEEKITLISNRILENENQKIHNLVKRFKVSYINRVKSENESLDYLTENITKSTVNVFQNLRNKYQQIFRNLQVSSSNLMKISEINLISANRNIDILNPANILKRGYSFVLKQGKLINSVSEISENETITNIVADGEIVSIIKIIKKNTND